MSKQNAAKHLPAGTGPTYWGPGDRVTFLITGEQSGGAFFMCDVLVPPDGGPPPHIHHREDEAFYVLEGTLSVVAAETTITAGPGDFVYVPRGTTHTFRDTGSIDCRMLVTITPAGFEKFFEETFHQGMPESEVTARPSPELMARMGAAASRHGLEFIPPH
jgi:mannose-6-phosphate isomerase-like protein (cupin superfamily)